MCNLQKFQNIEKQPVSCCKVYVIIYWLILAVESQKMMHCNLLLVHFKYTTLLYWIFMHLSIPTLRPTTGQGTKCHGRTIHSSWAPGSSPAIPTWFLHQDMPCDWQQGCAGTGLPRNPNPLLWEGRSQQSLLRPNLPCCPGFQLQAQLCPNLQCKVRHSRNPLLLQIPVCPSPSPILHRSLGSQFHTDLGMQLVGLKLPTHIIHHLLHSIIILLRASMCLKT